MTRTMYDGVDPSRLPVYCQLAAGYIDGLYAWEAAGWERFSAQTTLVRIACFAETNNGDFLDVEQGNAAPEQAPGWITMRRRAGHPFPAVYMNVDTWPRVRQAFADQHVIEPLYIVAEWDGKAAVPAGAFGKQYVSDNQAGFDLSVIGDYWPGVDPAPQYAPELRRNDMHVDLIEGKDVVFTNPAAALGGESRLCLACDFHPATIRVATYSFHTGGWTVNEYNLSDTGGALNLPLVPDVNKVSVNWLPGSLSGTAVGMDVYA